MKILIINISKTIEPLILNKFWLIHISEISKKFDKDNKALFKRYIKKLDFKTLIVFF